MNHEEATKRYFITVKGEQRGPFLRSQLDSMWRMGQITADAMYWEDGMSDKKPILEMFGSGKEINPPSEDKSESTSETVFFKDWREWH